MDDNMSCDASIKNLENKCFFMFLVLNLCPLSPNPLKTSTTRKKIFENSVLGFHVLYILSKWFNPFAHKLCLCLQPLPPYGGRIYLRTLSPHCPSPQISTTSSLLAKALPWRPAPARQFAQFLCFPSHS